jgi:hypothetical protein
VGRDYRRAETKLAAKECKNAKATVDTGVLYAEFLVKQEAIQILCCLVVDPRPDDRIFSLGLFDPGLMVTSVGQALYVLGRPELKPKVAKLIRNPRQNLFFRASRSVSTC